MNSSIGENINYGLYSCFYPIPIYQSHWILGNFSCHFDQKSSKETIKQRGLLWTMPKKAWCRSVWFCHWAVMRSTRNQGQTLILHVCSPGVPLPPPRPHGPKLSLGLTWDQCSNMWACGGYRLSKLWSSTSDPIGKTHSIQLLTPPQS